MPKLQVDAVLFDMDGTLIDERRSYREAIRLTAEYLLARSVTAEEVDEVKRVPGSNNDWDATWMLVGRHLNGSMVPPDPADRSSHAYRSLRDVFQTYYLGDELWCRLAQVEAPFPWSDPLMARETLLINLETLQRLSGFTLGIATSRPRVEALMAVHQHGLDRFFREEAIVARDDALFEKPHPAPLHELALRLGCSQPVYIGDTINDALAAVEAGMPFIYTPHLSSDPELDRKVRYRVTSVDEISDLLTPLSSATDPNR